MRLGVIFSTLWLMWLASSKADEPKIVCYYPSSSIERLDPSEIDTNLCTHLIYGFVRTTEDGDVSVANPRVDLSENGGKAGFQKFNALRKRNGKLKTLISINDQDSANLMKVISSPSLRSKYAKNIVDFVIRYEFDGVDIFGIPLTIFDDVQNYIILLKELRSRFYQRKLILSAHVTGTEVDARWYYNSPDIAKYVDLVLLTVECHKLTDRTVGHVAPLYPASRDKSSLDLVLNINATVHYWLNQGVPAEKLILGTQFYGLNYVLNNPAHHVPGSPANREAKSDSTSGHAGYTGICRMILQDNWISVWDEEQRVPYCYMGNQWISYENIRSLTEKAQYARALGLGGVMAWTIDQDDHRGHCAERYPLLKALNCGLFRVGCSATPSEALVSMKDKIVCVYRSWAAETIGYENLDASEIDPNMCTHLVYLHVGITEEGNVTINFPRTDLPDNGGKAGYQKFNALRKRNPKLKTLVSSNSGHDKASIYSKIAADPLLRSKYVENVVDFLLKYGFDGLTVYWQYPTINGGNPRDKQNFVLLLKDLRHNFDKHGLILGATATAAEAFATRFYDIPQISNYVDFIILIIDYRYNGEIETSHSAPLYPATREIASFDRTLNIHASVEYWLAQGAPAEKLILGTEFTGRRFTLNNSADHLPGSPGVTNQDKEDYSEVCRVVSQEGWTVVWDEEQRVPYGYKGNQWISYDNARSMTEKGKYAKSMGLGGIMGFALDMDDHRGDCGERYPLVNALKCGFRGIGCISPPTPDALTSDDDSDESAKKTCATFDLKYVRHSRNCARFWICLKIDAVEYHAEPFSCGIELHFDTVKNICKAKDRVQCN